MVSIKRVVSYILRAPLHLFLIGSFAASIYAAYNKIQGISWGTPVLFGAILIAWYFGVWLSRNSSNEEVMDSGGEDASNE